MKRAFVFLFAATLVAAAPAVAYALQEHTHEHSAASPKEPAHERPGEEIGAPEEAGPPKPINWTDFSNHEQPPWAFMFVNFVILMGIYYKYGKGPISQGLKDRKNNIAREIEEAQRMRKEAEARAAVYQEKLSHLETELKETREALKAAGEGERDRIVREAEEKAARMEKDAKFLVEQELKQLRVELTRDAVETAVAAAEELLRKRITPSDQERLAEDYLSQLAAKRPSGQERAAGPATQNQGGELMIAGVVARRYAKALLELGTELEQLDALVEEISAAAASYEGSVELQSALENPLFPYAVKKNIVADFAQTIGLGQTARNALFLLNDRRRMRALPGIARLLREMNDKKKGLLRAEVVTATALSETYYARLQQQLEKMTGRKVVLDKREDPTILAGVITRIGDTVYDGSLRSRLHEIKHALLPSA